MKICANCGTQVPDDAAFCNNCGSSLLNNDNAGSAPAAASSENEKAQGSAPAPAVTPAPVPAPAPAPAPNMAGPQPQQAPYGQGQFQPQQLYMQYDPKDHTSEFDARDIADNKLFAVIPYILGIIAGIIVGIYVKESPFVKFHIKNALRLEIAELLVCLLFIIPFIGWVAAVVLLIALIVVNIIAVVWVFQGKAKELPLISGIGFLK